MKASYILLLTSLAALAQAPQTVRFPDVPDDTVIATFDDGGKMTSGEFKNLLSVLPPDQQGPAMADRMAFIHEWALMHKLMLMAEKQELDQQSPTREKLEYYRMATLSEATMMSLQNSIRITPEEAKAYYEAHRDQYKQVRVKAIKIEYSAEGTPRSEAAAQALAAKIGSELRGGADFVKLVAQYSEDADSKAKNGDFTTIRGSDNIPEQILTAVMGLKQGDISAPIQQPTAFYIFRAEDVSYKSFDEVSADIYAQLHKDRSIQAMDKIDKSTTVDIKDPRFFNAPAPGGSGKQSGAH